MSETQEKGGVTKAEQRHHTVIRLILTAPSVALFIGAIWASLDATWADSMAFAIIWLVVAWLAIVLAAYIGAPPWDRRKKERLKITVAAGVLAMAFCVVIGIYEYHRASHKEPPPPSMSTSGPDSLIFNNQKGGQVAGTMNFYGPVTNAPVNGNLSDNDPGDFTEENNSLPLITIGCMRFAFMSKGSLSGSDFPILSFVHKDGRKDVAISGYIENGITKVNIRLTSPLGGDLFNLSHGKYSIFSKGWQVNHNKTSLEVINEDATPVLQIIRPNKSEVLLVGYIEMDQIIYWMTPVNGIVPTAYDSDGSFKPKPGYLPRIFKYPATQYPATLADNLSPTFGNCSLQGTFGMGKGLEIPVEN